MRKLVSLAAVIAFIAFVAVAAAITNGVPDGSAHPEVGALLAPQAFSDGTWEECTGTLIAPTGLPDRSSLRRGAQPGQGDVRLELRRTGDDLYRHLARRPELQQEQRRPARPRRRRLRPAT